jgi:spore coat polysaccharide biosynthesis protein SpsF
MNINQTYSTPQEEFWAGEFCESYIGRNDSHELLASNLAFFANALKLAPKIESCLELGANIGMNLKALKLLYPSIQLRGVEINKSAHDQLEALIGKGAYHGSIFDYQVKESVDLALIKTVLIHIDPQHLNPVYEKLYQASNRYILICEYYNTTPVAINYRGHEDRLFKRDFAGEMLDRYNDLVLIDYGFAYHRVPPFMNDDVTWFLMEKR